MANLLDQASIVLTPTAYDDGKVLCAKPSEAPYGDFDFSRNSAATRVNAQGLVENVQILSSNLVQNGDFSEEGVELITNGNFDTDSDWIKGAGWSISGGTANCDGTTSDTIRQNIGLVQNDFYKVTFEVSNISQGGIAIVLGGTIQLQTITQNGSYTLYSKSGVNPVLYFQPVNNFIGSIDNVSVREVGQDWSLSSANIEVGKLTLNSVGGAMTYAYQSGLNLVANTSYLISINATRISGDTDLTLNSTGGNNVAGSPIITTSGIQSYNFTPTTNVSNLGLKRNFGGSGAVWEITNFSVIEITDDTNLPRINYEGFSYQDALGSELITNGDFATDTGWNKGAGWSISGGTANCNGTTTNLISNIPITPSIGKQGKLRFEVTNYVSGQIALSLNGTGGGETGVFTPVNGFYEFDLFGVMQPTSTFITIYSSSFIGSIDNVSLKEYSGQIPIPNSGCGSWLFEPQSTNLVTYSEDFSDSSWIKSNMTVTPNSIISPDGTLNADELNGQYIYKNINVSGNTVYTFSFYVKNNSAANPEYAIYDLTNNSFIVGETSYLSEINNDTFVRVSVTFTTASNTLIIRPYPSRKANTTIYIWGAQVEQQSYATSYIPTEGSSVTRNRDVCNNGATGTGLINSAEGVLYAEIAKSSSFNDNQISISLNSGNANNRVMLFFGNNQQRINAQVRSGASTWFSSSFNLLTASTDFNKIAIKYKENDFSFWVNGSKIDQGSVGLAPVGLNELSFNVGSNNNLFFGKTKAVAVWKEALSDSELQSLTTI